MKKIIFSILLLVASLSLAACQSRSRTLPESALQEEELLDSEVEAVDKAPTDDAAVDHTIESIDQTLEELPEDDFDDAGFSEL